jgi:hypothetical protein
VPRNGVVEQAVSVATKYKAVNRQGAKVAKKSFIEPPRTPRTPRKACLCKNLGVLGVLGGSR